MYLYTELVVLLFKVSHFFFWFLQLLVGTFKSIHVHTVPSQRIQRGYLPCVFWFTVCVPYVQCCTTMQNILIKKELYCDLIFFPLIICIIYTLCNVSKRQTKDVYSNPLMYTTKE